MPDNQQSSDRWVLPRALGKVEAALQALYPDLDLQLTATAHYTADGFAHITVHNVTDQVMREKIRSLACEQLRNMGFPVEFIPEKDVYDFRPMHSD